MKKLYYLILGVLLYSCIDRPTPAETLRSKQEVSNFYHIDTNRIKVNPDGIVAIDGDMLLDPENLPDPDKKGQLSGNYTVDTTYSKNIKVFVRSTVPDIWRAQISNTFAAWNAVHANLQFSEVTRENDANIYVDTVYQASNMIAYAYLPTSSRLPGSSVHINMYHNGLADGYKLFALVHEFGHTIGFMHTDQGQGIQIPGTPTTDASSVMNAYVAPWNGLSYYDSVATRYLYPGSLSTSPTPTPKPGRDKKPHGPWK